MIDTMAGWIVYLLCMPILLVMAGILVNEIKPKKNIILGVTLPYDARENAQVLQICAVYKKRVWMSVLLLMLAGLLCCLAPWVSVQITLLFVWLIAVIVVPYLMFIKANLQLKALKREKEWFSQQYAAQTVVDLGTVGLVRRPLSVWWFIPPVLISLIPAVLAMIQYSGEDMTEWIVSSVSLAAVSLLSWFCYPHIFRQKADVVDEDSRVNAALTNVRRVNWGRAWIYIAWTTSLLGLGVWFFRESPVGMLVLSAVYCLVLCALCMYTELSVRRAQETITLHSGREQYVDEDEYWIWGMFYCNPNDRHLSVNSRVGMNMSFNLAHPAGKVIAVLSAMVIAALPFFGVWMMAMEFSPRTVQLTEDACIVSHVTKQFSVSYEDIRSAQLISGLPEYSSLSDSAIDSLCEGIYKVDGFGSCKVSFDPDNPPYLVLKTDDMTYIFNLESPEQTENCYNEILGKEDRYE